MKTIQALAAAAWLFPLVALATDHADKPHSSSAPPTTTVTPIGYPATSDAAQDPTYTGTLTVSEEVPTGTSTTIPTSTGSASNHLGCYKVPAINNGNPINTDGTGLATSLNYNAYSSCVIDYCGSYKYAAVMNGNMCFCSESLPELVKADDKECNVGCSGYSLDMCGGAAAINVFENKEYANGGDDKTTLVTSGTATSKPTESEKPASTTGTKGPASTDPVKAGASALVGQSWAFLAGVGAVFFL